MKKLFTALSMVFPLLGMSQGDYGRKFEQLETILPTPNTYRTASGAPGKDYWQQRADYEIEVELNDINQSITGSETITYHNNSPDILKYLWVQLDQNIREKDSDKFTTGNSAIEPVMNGKSLLEITNGYDYEGGYKIISVKGTAGEDLPHVINKTMMRVNLHVELKPGEKTSFSIQWVYNINDKMLDGGRSGYEFFPNDGNYVYAIAQFFPRMAVYDNVVGWQNKQFLGRGEFTLPFGDYKVKITVPADHIVGATGLLQNPDETLTNAQISKFEQAKKSDKPVIIVSQEEAIKKEKNPDTKNKSTWIFKADNVRDFAFASSRKFIWDAQKVDIGNNAPLAMSFYPKEGNPLWEEYSTVTVAKTLIGYSKRTIDYPYPVAISVHVASAGMEYPMICFNRGRPFEDGTYSSSIKWSMIGVIIHEVGHNFFPMIINSDERQWTWMDEGLNSFVQFLVEREFYPDKPVTRGTPETIVPYMKGGKDMIRPVMTNSEQILQFGNNAYSKPAAALNLLRNTVMGPDLFDYALKEYAQRWAFKHPTPADFFRTMEDASAVDLDWFWRGWFYSTDNVDVSVENVKWFRMAGMEPGFEKRMKSGKVTANSDGTGAANSLSNGFEEFKVIETDTRFYREFLNRVDDEDVIKKNTGKNFYEVTFKNIGGLVTPLVLEWTYADGSVEIEKVPAEIWRYNENEITKVFTKEKQVINLKLDPMNELADTESSNNNFPREEDKSRFEQFKNKTKN
jgi:hypothetical protein